MQNLVLKFVFLYQQLLSLFIFSKSNEDISLHFFIEVYFLIKIRLFSNYLYAKRSIYNNKKQYEN